MTSGERRSSQRRRLVPSHPSRPGRRKQPVRLARSISDITVEHGPVDLLGRFFLKADTAARKRGVTLSFAPMQELVGRQRRNTDDVATAAAAVQHRDATVSPPTRPSASSAATPTATWSRRRPRASTTGRTSASSTRPTSLRLFYADPGAAQSSRRASRSRRPRPSRSTGSVVFAGGVWYRPDFRGGGCRTSCRASRAPTPTRAGSTTTTISIMAEEVVKRRHGASAAATARSTGSWADATRPRATCAAGSCGWSSSELLGGLADSFLPRFDTQVDVGVDKRRASRCWPSSLQRQQQAAVAEARRAAAACDHRVDVAEAGSPSRITSR